MHIHPTSMGVLAEATDATPQVRSANSAPWPQDAARRNFNARMAYRRARAHKATLLRHEADNQYTWQTST